MNDMLDIFKDFFGPEFICRLRIAGIAIAVLAVVVITMLIWRAVAAGKVKRAVLMISEYPDAEHADEFIAAMEGISPVGRFFAKSGATFSGLPRSECRSIFNTTVLPSERISSGQKATIHDLLTRLGCRGLTVPM